MAIGGYFVEGHVPVEAIEKLLTEKPDIAGIAMQGMPLGSPGMPGDKVMPFIIFAVHKDGSIHVPTPFACSRQSLLNPPWPSVSGETTTIRRPVLR